jgi:hypothetical protein
MFFFFLFFFSFFLVVFHNFHIKLLLKSIIKPPTVRVLAAVAMPAEPEFRDNRWEIGRNRAENGKIGQFYI